MSERMKFGPTQLSLKGVGEDPLFPGEPAQLYSAVMGEGRIPFQTMPMGVSIIESNSGSLLRINVEDHFLRVSVLDPDHLDPFFRPAYYFVAGINSTNGFLELSINNKDPKDPKKKHPDIHPEVLLDEAFAYFTSRGVAIPGIAAKWQPGGDNYDTFTQLVARGMFPENAAAQTWTGKQASKRGYAIHDPAKDVTQHGADINVNFSK